MRTLVANGTVVTALDTFRADVLIDGEVISAIRHGLTPWRERGRVLVFDPSRTITISASSHHSRVDYSLYEGLEVRGVPITVLLRGMPVIEDCQLVGKRGAGRFVKRAAFQMNG